MRLKQNIQHYLNTSGLTASALARKTSLPKTTIANWLAGVAPRDLVQLKKLADYIGVSIDTLTFDDLSEPIQLKSTQILDLENFFQGDFRISIQRIRK
jgi:transcriptional regulator with XRE-family HTH domain